MADLRPRRFEPLLLGEVRPRGWLRRQLRVQADGLTGHLDEFWPDLADNRWLGGERDGWERGPYYADGLVPLAYLLDDDDLKAKAEKWVEGFLDQRSESGFVGPVTARGDYKERDPWPRFVVLKVLRQYHEATGDEESLEAMVDYADYLGPALENRPLFSWGKFRWADLVVSLHWLYERTGEEWLLDVAETAHRQGYDWRGHFADFDYLDPVAPEDSEMATHVVNNAMGLKAPGVWVRQSGDEDDAAAARAAPEALDRFHGQATGLFTGDEHLGGRDPSRGTELCAVVEYMYSLERLVSALGDVAFGDRLERVAYNALPAAFSADMWAHQYDQQANQVVCDVSEKEWTNGPDANLFGLEPHYGCCTANCHQGWPKFAASLWMRDGERGGLAAVAYGPSVVETTVAGERVRVTERTDYPFGETVEFDVDPEAPVAFPLTLRVPSWAAGATLRTPDGVADLDAGTHHAVEREWTGGETLTLALPASVEADRRFRGSVAFRRGPLVLARPIANERKQIAGERPHADWEVYPTEAWNHAVVGDAAAVEASVEAGAPGEVPFDPADPPLEARVDAARLPSWTLEDNRAGPLPVSPADRDADREVRLVPYGGTDLRVTEFPLLDPPA